MKSPRISALVLGLCVFSVTAATPFELAAQEEDVPAVYASYFQCDPTRLARIDSLMTTFWGPIQDRYVTSGKVTAWGWLGHHTGADWDRVFYSVSPDINDAVDTNDQSLSDAIKENAQLVRETFEGCPRHEDYIWQRVGGSQASAEFATARPAAGLSIYYECDQSREQRADEIVLTDFAPSLNRLVESGDMNSWAWLEHVVGGKYRRLLVTDGRDARTLIGAIGKLTDELRIQEPKAFTELTGICSSHQDVIWSMRITKP